MSELLEFLRARLDEDEQVARAAMRKASDANWTSGDLCDSICAGNSGDYVVVGPYGYLADELKAYLVMNDPARVLTEVEAKRRILDLIPEINNIDRLVESEWGSGPEWATVMDRLLRLMALPYVSHPDYSPVWSDNP